jgi:hypothetical protein
LVSKLPVVVVVFGVDIVCLLTIFWLRSFFLLCTLRFIGVLLSITPKTSIRKLGQKMLYFWVIPAWMMMISCGGLVTATWSQAEIGYRMAKAANSTTTRNVNQEFVIVWVSRLCYFGTLSVCFVALLMIFFCAGSMGKYLGIESQDVSIKHSRAAKSNMKRLHEKRESKTKEADMEHSLLGNSF